jgi:hypothetical protein
MLERFAFSLKGDDGGGVENGVAPMHGLTKRTRIANVSNTVFDIDATDCVKVGVWPSKDLDIAAMLHEL